MDNTKITTEDLKSNYYALLISICLNKTPSRALMLMGLTEGYGINSGTCKEPY